MRNEQTPDQRLAVALEEFYSYLSDNLAPLLVEGAVEQLLAQPVEFTAGGVRAWVASQFNARGGTTPVSDLFFHAARKIHLLAELKLVARERIDAFLASLAPSLLEDTPPDERETLRINLTRVGEAHVAASAAVTHLHRAGAGPATPALGSVTADASLTPEMMRGLRRFALMLEQGASSPAAGVAGAVAYSPTGENASQLLAAAVENSRNARELEQYMKHAGLGDGGGAEAIRALSRNLPAWVLHQGEQVSTYQGSSALAMQRLVTLADDPAKSADRFREMVHAAIEQVNTGSLARAVAILELAQKIIDERSIEPHSAELVRGSAHEALDARRLLALTRDPEQFPLLRKVLAFFPATSPAALLDGLTGEPDRQRRRLQIALLEVHGAGARQLALDRLEASLAEQPRRSNAWWHERNYVYLMHRIAPTPGMLPEKEVQYLIRLSGLENEAPLVRESLICLGQARHERALPALEQRLHEVEEQLLQEGGPAYHPAPELWRFLNLIVAGLARSGTTSGRRAVVEHALRANPKLGDTLARLAELQGIDLSDDPELVARLLTALRGAIPVKVFGMLIQRDADSLVNLLRTLSATPAPTVQQAFSELARRFPEQPFGKLAGELLQALQERAALPAAAAPSPRATGGLSGDLEVFGLPDLVQSLSQGEASGALVIRDRGGHEMATLWMRRGLLIRAQSGHLQGEAAFFQLLECPTPGTFEFSRREAGEATHSGVTGQAFTPLLMEAMRRHDELQRARAMLADHARVRPTGVRPTAPAEETDGVFLRDLWTKVKSGTTPAECESEIALDAYRIRALLAHWLEEGVIEIAAVATN